MLESTQGLCCPLLSAKVLLFVLTAQQNGMTDYIQLWHVDVTGHQGVPYFKVILNLQLKKTIMLNFFVYRQYLNM